MSEENGVNQHFYSPAKNADNAEIRLMRKLETECGRKFTDYEDFYRFTCDKYPTFWKAVLEFCDIRIYSNYTQIVEDKPIEQVPKWFLGATTNYTDNCLKNGDPNKIAFVQAYPDRTYKKYSYDQLKRDVASVAHHMRNEFGLKKGDKVCAYLPNIYECAVAMLATASFGGVWSSTSTDFGPSGVLDRFSQVQPKLLLASDTISYKQKNYSLTKNVNEIVEGLPSLEKVVIIRKNSDSNEFVSKEKFVFWSDLMDHQTAELIFEPCFFDHPLFILFSSGTTGAPKCLVHSVGGMLLKHFEEHVIQTDFTEKDTIFFYTTCGWMMWNWLMSVLLTGATIVLYEESPLEPDPHILLKIAADTEATCLGMGAKIFDEYAKMAIDFKTLYKLDSLRLVLSTASPLKASTFDFINEYIRPQVCIGSISGGTDIVGCFMGATLNRPVIVGECQHYYLGCDMASLDEDGNEVVDQRGELVCKKPFPSMPIYFLNDSDGIRYKSAYFNKFDGVWTHGDFVFYNSKTNGIFIYGRSDTTLNRSGVRIGTSELYAIVERFIEISDSIVVGQKDPLDDDNELIVLFVKMTKDVQLTEQLKAQIKTTLRHRVSPRHVPNMIEEIEDIPYTNSGKKVELAVKQIINKETVKNINSLRNPESLELYRKFQL